MKDDTKHALILLAIFLLYGIVGHFDYEYQVELEHANAPQHVAQVHP